MGKHLAAVNVGSSSIKLSFFTVEKPPCCIANAEISGLAASPVVEVNGDSENLQCSPNDIAHAFEILLSRCLAHSTVAINEKENLGYICHRIVHGGDYEDAIEITDKTLADLERIEDLAPLHNAPALQVVRACVQGLPRAKNMAYFDSSFHRSLPEHVRTYPIDQAIAHRKGLRKYGFHGLSYSYVLRSVAVALELPVDQTNLIVMHLGSGASVCAIANGKSIDTSMGLTPLDGLPGATRSGTVDPSLIFHYTSEAATLSTASTLEMHLTNAEEILNKQSGWKALAGTSNFADLEVDSLAFDLFVDRIIGFVGSYYVKLQGKVDAIVFAGGVGEKSSKLRQRVVDPLGFLGFHYDRTKNKQVSNGAIVEDFSTLDATKRVLVCHTNEQSEMAHLFVNS